MGLYTLNAAQSIVNYGFQVLGSTYDPVFTKSYLQSSPNISISGNSLYIDYSNSFNNSDRTTLIKLFKNTPVGTTFSVSNAEYVDRELSVVSDLSVIFRLENLTNNDQLVIGGLVSGITVDPTYTYYVSDNFSNPPQYSTNYTGGTGVNYIINTLNDSKFKSLSNKGLLGSVFSKEEYIEISGSTLNSGKLLVNGCLQLKDKKEVLYCGVTLTNENLLNRETTMTQYLRGESNPEILSKSRKSLGCYVIYDELGNQIDCFERQNELQAYLRSQFEGATLSTQWFVCDSCSRLGENAFDAANPDKSFEFEASIFAKVLTSFDNNNNPVYQLLLNYPTSFTLRTSSSIAVSVTNGFKLDLSHPTLKGYSITTYGEEEKINEVTQSIYYYGVPGYDQSSLVYQKTLTSPRSLYIVFEGPVIFTLEVVIG
jgi:hypothetical protein